MSLINHLLIGSIADRDQASIANAHGSSTRKELRENEYTWLTLASAGIDRFAEFLVVFSQHLSLVRNSRRSGRDLFIIVRDSRR
jgi:hypothetical protein